VNESKTCTQCCQILPLESFYKTGADKSKLTAACKSCASATCRVRHLKNKESNNAHSRAYYQTNKEQVKATSLAWYAANKESVCVKRRIYYLENKEAIGVAQRAYRETNREEVNAKGRAYAKAHPEKRAKGNIKRRAQKIDSGIFEISSKEILRIRSSPCTFCNATDNIQIDHVIPLSKGGRHSIGNLQPLCQPCNGSKNANFYSVFRYRSRSEL